MTFYDVRGMLVRRIRMPVQRSISLERWNGEDWLKYSDVEEVLRYGVRLTEAQALTLLSETRNRVETLLQLSDTEARRALHAPRE